MDPSLTRTRPTAHALDGNLHAVSKSIPQKSRFMSFSSFSAIIHHENVKYGHSLFFLLQSILIERSFANHVTRVSNIKDFERFAPHRRNGRFRHMHLISNLFN